MRIDRFCGAVNSPGDGSLKFLVETASTNEVLWQLRSTPRRFRFLNDSPPRSLRHVLFNGELTALKDRRTLALKLVYAFIQYYGSTYIQEILEHDSIFFHPLTQNALNFDAPFVIAPIPAPPDALQDLDMGVQHPCSSLLTLGIRLLEIHKGKPLEFYLTDTERQGLSPNTKLAVAWRLYHNLEEWCSFYYKAAVYACLQIPWVTAGKKVDFRVQKICDGFYENVVENLESDVFSLFGTRT